MVFAPIQNGPDRSGHAAFAIRRGARKRIRADAWQQNRLRRNLGMSVAPDCPIKFYFRSTKEENIANSDDLYIKMNARGKKLTDFENFKSELFSFKDDEGKELFREDRIYQEFRK